MRRLVWVVGIGASGSRVVGATRATRCARPRGGHRAEALSQAGLLPLTMDVTTLDITTNSVTVKLTRTTNDGPAEQFADAELHFTGGALAGLKLLGFGISTARDGRPTVTFPARQYSADGRRRTFRLLRDIAGHTAADALRDLILQASADTHGDHVAPAALEKA